MIVLLRDRTELIVTKKVASTIAQSLKKSLDGYITINGILVNKRFIDMIKPGGITEADGIPNEPNRRIRQDNRSEQEQYRAARKKANEIRKKIIKKVSMK